jgi:hypothetical protein
VDERVHPEGRRSPQRPDTADLERPPSWAGAPGYTPYPEPVPHAPMPGAPPYPAQTAPPPTPPGRPARRSTLAAALGAVALWAGVDLLVELVAAPVTAGRLLAIAVAALLAAVATALVARGRRWSFLVLLLVAAPVFWVLRAFTTLLA